MVGKEEVHPLVTLLTERMKSHPEEFEDDYPTTMDEEVECIKGRWQYAITEIYNHGSDQDGGALREGMRTIRLDKAHKWALDELLNGEGRRAQEKREREEREKAYEQLTRAATAQMPISNLSGLAGAQRNALANVMGTYPQGRFEQRSTDATLLSKLRKGLGI